MFLLNVGYKWNHLSSVEQLQGAVFLASGNSHERLSRSGVSEHQRILFDPQMYLAGLDAEQCTKTCARLASHPWFAVPDLPDFDSQSMTRREWDKQLQAVVGATWPGDAPTGDDAGAAAFSAVDFQLELGCTHMILPAPLIDTREGEAEIAGTWVDVGLEVAEELDVAQPLLATVAVLDSVLNEMAFENGGLLDTIVDQISARDGLDGVYLVIAQTQAEHPFSPKESIAPAYAHLCSRFRAAGLQFIIPNFADLFGYGCYALGASDFATGASQALRRLALSSFVDKGGGTPFPRLYSHRAAAEYLTESDLDKLATKRLLRRIRDVTPHSRALFEAMSRGATAGSVGSWAESRNNVTAAQNHFLSCVVREDRGMAGLDLAERQDVILDWLEEAHSHQLLIERRMGEDGPVGITAPVEEWLDVLNESSELVD